MSGYAFIDPNTSYPLPREFDFQDYIETEREFWALFPETTGMRVNFLQMGLTAQIYTESFDNGSELQPEETYLLMPCANGMRPMRMRAVRRLTLTEFRMTQLTAMKLRGKMAGTGDILDRVHETVLGPELIRELHG